MKISALRLFNVKRFANRGVAIEGIGDGVNVLCAANEFGKSTSFEALHALFFQPHSGTPNDVKALRPYSGGNPLIEADIVTAQGDFRITKQYYGGRSARVADLTTGRLIAQADEAENFIAELTRGGASGPAGLLWVRQGITGIEKRTKSEEDNEKQVRASLLESVQGEVEAVTGGRRMAEIMAACEDALSEIVTATRRPKTGGRYAAAIEQRDRLASEEKRLGDEVTALRDALDKRADAMKRLAELDNADDRAQRKLDVEAAQARFDAAKSQGEMLKTAEAELRLARERRDVAEQELKTFRRALAEAAELREKLEAANQRRAEAVTKRSDATSTIAAARQKAEAAEAAEQEARDLLARLDAALKAREAFEQLEKLKERLTAADSIRQQIEAAEAKLASVKIAPAGIDDLQDLELEIAKLRAVEESAKPSVSVVYDNGAPAITLDGAPLVAGDEHRYDGQAQLLIPGIGTLTLRSNRQVKSDNRLEKTEERRHALLAQLGVADLAEARARQNHANQIDSDLRELRARLSLLAPEGLAKLREAVAAHSGIDAAALELKADPETVRNAYQHAEETRKEARQSLREVEPLQARADEAFLAIETELAKLNADAARLDAVLGPIADRPARETALDTKASETTLAFREAEINAERLRAGAVDLDSVEAALKRARSVADAAEKQINSLRETIAGHNSEIRARADDAVEENWREVSEKLEAATARVKAFEKEVAVLDRLSKTLDAARSEARELYLKPVMSELKPLLGLLFDDASITIDDKTLLPHKISRNGQEEEVDRLSGGMREQLSVLTRLAFARLLARDGRPAPVILDDALVYSDDDRIEKMFDALHRQSRDQQIIVFSCRQRAFQKLGGNVLQMKDWLPG